MLFDNIGFVERVTVVSGDCDILQLALLFEKLIIKALYRAGKFPLFPLPPHPSPVLLFFLRLRKTSI
jgi:hypothetical protein